MPFISELLETQLVLNEYIETKFEDSFSTLIKPVSEGGRGYTHIRRLRRDGNCFYRAFLFQLFEHYAMNMNTDEQTKLNYAKLVNVIIESKEDLVKNGGYDEIVVEDFYDTFLEALQKLEELPKLYEEWKKIEPSD